MPKYVKKTSSKKPSYTRKTNNTKSYTSPQVRVSKPSQAQLMKMLPNDQRPRAQYFHLTPEEKVQYHLQNQQILYKSSLVYPEVSVLGPPQAEDGLSSTMSVDESGPVE